MNSRKEVADKIKEVIAHARECWGFVWKNDEGRALASETAASFDESFHYFDGEDFCLWDINTHRKAEEIESVTPYFDDSEEDEDAWSCDLYFVFRGGAELLVTSYSMDGSLGFLLEVKGKKIQTQDPEEIRNYFAQN